ncbi:MAG: hypothetical protein OSJ58_17370 [Dysosmobacter sp.]|nr:hypothetical protein [Dysosmobacter sp.]
MAKTSLTKKTTNPQQTAPQPEAAPVLTEKKSPLPVIAAVLLLVSELLPVLWIAVPVLQRVPLRVVIRSILIYLSGETYVGRRPGFPVLDVLLGLFLITSLFLRRKKTLVPAALALTGLNSLGKIVLLTVGALAGFDIGINMNYVCMWYFMELVTLLMSSLALLLVLPKVQNIMCEAWLLPSIAGAVILLIAAFKGWTYEVDLLSYCIDVYAYAFLCFWMASPDRDPAAASMPRPNVSTIYRVVSFLRENQILIGPILGAVMSSSVLVASVSETGHIFKAFHGNNAFIIPSLLFIFPLVWLIYLVRKGAKVTKRINHDINVINAQGTGFVAEQAKAELRKEAGKKAANAVIKGALVGDLIGGDTGAVVGAMAAKAKLDQTTGSDGSMSDVTKGAVVGGIVAGSSSAVVGGLAAQAQKDAEDGIK